MANTTAAKKDEPKVGDDQATDGQVNESKEPDANEAEAKVTPVIASRMQLEVEANNTYRVNVPHEITPENCMEETFWSHVSMQLIIGDTLIVMPDSMEWKLILHVANCGREFAHVVKLQLYDLATDPSVRAAASRYSTDFAGTTKKWRFKLDGKVLRDGYATEALAKRAAKNHQMAVDRAK